MREAPIFYWLYTLLIVVGAGVILIPKFPLVRMILLSQVLNGMLLPFVLIFMVLLINKVDLMGEWTNSRCVQPGHLGDGRDHDRPDAGAGRHHRPRHALRDSLENASRPGDRRDWHGFRRLCGTRCQPRLSPGSRHTAPYFPSQGPVVCQTV